MAKTVFKLKPKQRKKEGLARLSEKLAEKLGADARILQNLSNSALKNFEKSTRVRVMNLFLTEPHQVSCVIPLMMNFFETEFEQIFSTKGDLDQALDITRNGLEEMYGIN